MSNKATHHDPWDEGELGRSIDHVEVVSPTDCKVVDDSLDLQLVSIRLQKGLVTKLKAIAEHHGLAYQPMIRDLLNRFAVSEIKQILQDRYIEVKRQLDEAKSQSEAVPEKGPVAEFLDRERKRA